MPSSQSWNKVKSSNGSEVMTVQGYKNKLPENRIP